MKKIISSALLSVVLLAGPVSAMTPQEKAAQIQWIIKGTQCAMAFGHSNADASSLHTKYTLNDPHTFSDEQIERDSVMTTELMFMQVRDERIAENPDIDPPHSALFVSVQADRQAKDNEMAKKAIERREAEDERARQAEIQREIDEHFGSWERQFNDQSRFIKEQDISDMDELFGSDDYCYLEEDQQLVYN